MFSAVIQPNKGKVFMLDVVNETMPEQETACEQPPNTFDIATVQHVVGAHFPELWPAVEAGLSTCATLLLSDNTRMSRSPLKFLERLPWLSHAAFFV
jgi:hypothetical protein